MGRRAGAPRGSLLTPRRRGAGALAVLAAAAVLPAALAGCGGSGPSPSAGGPVVAVRIDTSRVVMRSRLALGITHTELSLDAPAPPARIAMARRLAASLARVQNQQIYGWGATNPEPRPGVFAWSSLDRRVELMRSLPGTPVITLCCAPDWMTRLARASTTYPNLPPTPSHVADFAQLAARIARRYPDIRHFIVWNELKGYYSRRLRNWDAVAYTRLYNATYDALKAVNPRIQVGGPYIVLQGTGSGAAAGRRTWGTADPIIRRDRAFLRRWFALAHGADFLTIDRSLVSPSHDPNRYPKRVLIGLTHWFGDIVEQLRRMTRLPIWYVENYIHPDAAGRFVDAATASMLLHELRAGVAVSLRWRPQASGPSGDAANAEALWADPRRPGGGRPLPEAAVYAAFDRHFPPGTPIVAAATGSPALEVLASQRAALLVNTRPSALVALVSGRRIPIPGYGVRVVALRPGG